MAQIRITLSILATILFLSACARYTNLIKEGKVVLEVMPTKSAVKLTGVTVREKYTKLQMPELEISGYVKRVGLGVTHGHVDVAILDANRKILAMANRRYVPAIIRQKGSRQSAFNIRFSTIKQDNYIVRVAFHSDATSGNLNCGNNQAYLT